MSEVAKKPIKVDTSAIALERLRRASARRAKRYANDRVVYAYRHKDYGVSDNLILLPLDTEEGHKAFLERQMSLVLQSGADSSKLRGYSVVKVGVFNKLEFTFKKCSPVVIIDLDDVIVKVDNLKTKENTNV